MLSRLPGFRSLSGWRRNLAQRWLDRRVPPEPPRLTLHRRRLFILPTRLGFTFALTLALLLLGSLNYGTSMGFMVTFLLAGSGTLGMLHTYRNVEGLEVVFSPAPAVFAGETAQFPVRVASTGRARWGIALVPEAHPEISFHVPEETPVATNLPCVAPHRGRLHPGRVQLATEWPLALFRTWSWLHPSIGSLVYPRPVDHGLTLPEAGPTGRRTTRTRGDDEFSGLRDYQPGDPPRRIAWKTLARTGELHTKAFEATPSGERWLDWEALGSLPAEQRLEQICYWILALDRAGGRYGLNLAGQRFGPDRGPHHRRRCLEALALFGLPPEDTGA